MVMPCSSPRAIACQRELDVFISTTSPNHSPIVPVKHPFSETCFKAARQSSLKGLQVNRSKVQKPKQGQVPFLLLQGLQGKREGSQDSRARCSTTGGQDKGTTVARERHDEDNSNITGFKTQQSRTRAHKLDSRWLSLTPTKF